jgi:hypothetical protein
VFSASSFNYLRKEGKGRRIAEPKFRKEDILYYEHQHGSTVVLLCGACPNGTLRSVKNMLISAFILVISIAAMVQFAVFTWRAGLLRTASEPLPNDAELSSLSRNLLESKSFSAVSAYQELCPELVAGAGSNLRSVRLYYRFLQFMGKLGNSAMEAATPTCWTQREMALCTRYATVVLSHRLERTQAFAAQIRSY